MRKKETLYEEWLQKTFRVRIETINLYKYLEFYGARNDIAKDLLFERIANYSLSYIEEHHPKFDFQDTEVRRVVKGFTLSENTLNKLLNFVKSQKGVKKGEAIEILIGLYAIKHLSAEEMSKLDMYIKFVDDLK